MVSCGAAGGVSRSCRLFVGSKEEEEDDAEEEEVATAGASRSPEVVEGCPVGASEGSDGRVGGGCSQVSPGEGKVTAATLRVSTT